MNMQEAINAVIQKKDLSREEMESVMQTIMTGNATDAQIGGFLVGLRMKGETVDEITAAAEVMRSLATKVPVTGDHLVDTCGTGGDGVSTFNVSTACAFVVAAAGAQVAKHGNRSISSKSGSADLLEVAGANLDLSAEQVAECVEKTGVGFMFAPKHHGAMKHAIGPRKEMGARTIFNLLGPLTNPAGAPNQVLGVFSEQWLVPVATVLGKLGSRHVMVVHGEDGMDEISISAPTKAAELKAGKVSEYTIQPEDFGYEKADVKQLQVADAKESLALIQRIFENQQGAARNIVCLNSGAAIYVAGLVDNLQDGVRRAEEIIASGAAKEKMAAFINATNQFK